jgi:hypothetical protein
MHSGKREARDFKVVEIHALPVIDRVTCLALGRKSRTDVVWRSRLLERSLMAGIALNGESLKLPDGFTLVAIRAIQSGVATHEGKTIIVFFYPLGNGAPSLHRVTLFAICTHLPAVDVGMTVGAVRSRVREDRLGVALRARNTLMLAAQWVAGGVVVEFRHRPDGFPSDGGMAVLARDGQVAMGASRD